MAQPASVIAADVHTPGVAALVRGLAERGLDRVRVLHGDVSRPTSVQEILLQVAVYAGVPAANRAFAVAQRVLAEVAGDPPGA